MFDFLGDIINTVSGVFGGSSEESAQTGAPTRSFLDKFGAAGSKALADRRGGTDTIIKSSAYSGAGVNLQAKQSEALGPEAVQSAPIAEITDWWIRRMQQIAEEIGTV